jgi:hypothetical protein
MLYNNHHDPLTHHVKPSEPYGHPESHSSLLLSIFAHLFLKISFKTRKCKLMGDGSRSRNSLKPEMGEMGEMGDEGIQVKNGA